LDCRKTGHRYKYLVTWKSLPESDDSWLPLSDIPTLFNELIECYHCRHPHSPCPHVINMNKNYHNSLATTDNLLSSSARLRCLLHLSRLQSLPHLPSLPFLPLLPVVKIQPNLGCCYNHMYPYSFSSHLYLVYYVT
ncbi:hypothetical protein BDR07DRAFT_1268801, partial [Suillus spraguei]